MTTSALSSGSAAGPFRSSPIAYRDRESSSGIEPLPMYVWTTGIRDLATSFLRLSLASALAIPAPAMMTGNLALLISWAAAFKWLVEGLVNSMVERIRGLPSAFASAISSETSRWQDPGFSVSAMLKALRTDSGIVSDFCILEFHLVIG